MNHKIIDFHAHIFPDKVMNKAVDSIGRFYDLKMHGTGSPEDLIFHGSKIGTQYYVVHSVATVPSQVLSINDFISREVQLNSNFIGFATLHPDMLNADAEIERAIKLGLKGIKLHPDFQKFDINSKAALDLYECIDGRLPILMHIGDKNLEYSRPHKLAAVVKLYPNQVFIAGHLGGYNAWDEAKKYLIGQDLYIDTSSSLSFLDAKSATYMIHAHGAGKVLFGTDYPMWLHEAELKRFMALQLSDTERYMILGKNAAGLLQLNL